MVEFLFGVFGNLLAAELAPWLRRFATYLIIRTASKLPSTHRHRMREEWLALLDDTPGDLSKVILAFSLFLNCSALVKEYAAPQSRIFNSADPLTEREREILTLVAQGMTNKEVADHLCISRNTVRYHLKGIYDKLSLQKRPL